MFKKVITILLVLAVIQGCGAAQYKGKLYKKYEKYEKENNISVSDRKNRRYFRGEIKYSTFDDQMLMVIVEDKTLKLEDIVESNIAYNKQKAEEDAKKKAENTTKSAISTTESSITTEGAVTTAAAVVSESKDAEEIDAFKKKKKKVELKEIYKIYMGIKYRGRDWIYINRVKLKDSKTGVETEIKFGKAFSQDVILEDGVTLTGGVYETAFFTVTREEAEKLYNIAKSENLEMTLFSMYDGRSMTRKVEEKEKREIINTFEFFKKLDEQEKERIKLGIAEKERADFEKEKSDKNKEKSEESEIEKNKDGEESDNNSKNKEDKKVEKRAEEVKK